MSRICQSRRKDVTSSNITMEAATFTDYIFDSQILRYVFVATRARIFDNLIIVDSPTLKGPGPTYMCQKNLGPKNPGVSNAQIEIYLFS